MSRADVKLLIELDVSRLDDVERALNALRALRRPAKYGYFFVEGVGVMPLEVRDDASDKVFRVSYVDKEGNAAPLEEGATPVWSSSDESAVTVAPADDGLSAVVSFGSPGASVLEARATQTSDAGDEYEIVVSDTITVTTGEPQSGAFTVEEVA